MRRYKRVKRRYSTKVARKKISKSFRAKVKKVMVQTAENKYAISTGTLAPQRTAITVQDFNLDLITQGTGDSNRIGNQIKVKSLNLRTNIIFNPGGGGGNVVGTCRVLVLFPRKSQGGGPPLQTDFGNWLAIPNPDRWVVMFDRFYDMGVFDVTKYGAGNKSHQTVRWGRKFNYTVNYNGANVDREPYIVWLSTVPDNGASYFQIIFAKKVNFVDI